MYKRILPREVRKENGKRWLLHFGAVDQFAAVYINKILVTKHLGGYLPFTADVTDALKEGENELLVAVRDFYGSLLLQPGKAETCERRNVLYCTERNLADRMDGAGSRPIYYRDKDYTSI